MTENKRFYMDSSADLWDRKGNKVIVDFGYSLNGAECKWIIDLLNELNDENITLKKDNETLKIKNKNLIKISSHTQVKNDSLKKENEQLKKKVKTLEDTIDGLTGTIAHFDLEEVL